MIHVKSEFIGNQSHEVRDVIKSTFLFDFCRQKFQEYFFFFENKPPSRFNYQEFINFLFKIGCQINL